MSTENEPEARLDAEGAPYVNPGELQLLDWFAGCALVGLIMKRGIQIYRENDGLAKDAFLVAREMLEARAKHVPREEEG